MSTIVKGTSTYFVSGIVSSIAPFIISLLVSRYLGKEALGLFSLCFTLVLAGVLFSDLGLNSFIMREFAGTRKPEHVQFESLLIVRFVASVIAAIGLACATIALIPSNDMLLLTGSVFGLIVFRSVAGTLENLVKARMQRITSLLLTIGGSAAHVFSVYFMLNTGATLNGVLCIMTTVELIKIPVLFIVTRVEFGLSPSRQSFNNMKSVLLKGLPFAIVGILILLNERAGLFLLAWLKGTSEAGIFSAADRFMIIGMLLDSSLLSSAFPIFSLLRERISLDRVTRQSLIVVLSTAILGSVILYAIAPWLIGLTFRFPESIQLLRILSLSLPAIAMNSILRIALFSMYRERSVAGAYGICFIINIGICIVFIPHFGATAAAFVAVIVEYCLSVMYGVLYFRAMASP